MNTLNACPCCSQSLLRHARQGNIYWFCSHCRQEMPNLYTVVARSQTKAKLLEDLSQVLDLV
jgi:ribosomal protein L37AE/L43A